jgi:uncharacterized coiled-coil DUF342 family protein
MYECPKCGKTYKTKGVYYQRHIDSCTGKKPLKKTKRTITKPIKIEESGEIIKRLAIIESRLNRLEQNFNELKLGQVVRSEIHNEAQFLEIINQKVLELSQKSLGIQKVLLKDLFKDIKKDYDISRNMFSNFLIKLNNMNKIQLEPGTSMDDFSIQDNYGNVFKLIRILD